MDSFYERNFVEGVLKKAYPESTHVFFDLDHNEVFVVKKREESKKNGKDAPKKMKVLFTCSIKSIKQLSETWIQLNTVGLEMSKFDDDDD